jgi:hypothetical protein
MNLGKAKLEDSGVTADKHKGDEKMVACAERCSLSTGLNLKLDSSKQLRTFSERKYRNWSGTG